jgi:hypothetical protein
MTTPKTLAPLQELASFALAAVMTAGVLLSLGAQADTQHADALAAAQGSSQHLCAAPQRSDRG